MDSIVYLYSEIMPYQSVIFKEYSKMGYRVHAFYFGDKKQTPYNPPEIVNVKYYPYLNGNRNTLLEKVKEITPSILLVCGWANNDYMYVARYFKKKQTIPVICPIDTQFINKFKQYIGFLTSKFYIKRAFTHIWVPGVRQYEFARLLGYSKDKILFNSLSGDTELFNKTKIEVKINNYPRHFLYVGRFNKVKGLDLLIKAWIDIKDKKGWTITLIGNGVEKDKLLGIDGIEVLDFMSQIDLLKIAQNSGCFILPSIYEPWALVLHEFAAAGLPIICSDSCGASVTFVENGFNGYKFKNNDVEDLKKKIVSILNCNSDELIRMSLNSRKLSNRITPEISAASFLSTLINKT